MTLLLWETQTSLLFIEALIQKQKEGKTTYEGTRIDDIRSQFGLEQLIHKSADIIGETSSFMDLIYAS